MSLLLIGLGSGVLLGWVWGRYGRDRAEAEIVDMDEKLHRAAATNERVVKKLDLARERPWWVSPHRRGWTPDKLRAAGARETWRN